MPTVYIPNNGGHDYSAAASFGEPYICTRGSMDRFDVSQMYRELNDALEEASADDFILITSLTSLCCVACSIMAHKFGRINLLLHQHGVGYTSRTIVLTTEKVYQR